MQGSRKPEAIALTVVLALLVSSWIWRGYKPRLRIKGQALEALAHSAAGAVLAVGSLAGGGSSDSTPVRDDSNRTPTPLSSPAGIFRFARRKPSTDVPGSVRSSLPDCDNSTPSLRDNAMHPKNVFPQYAVVDFPANFH